MKKQLLLLAIGTILLSSCGMHHNKIRYSKAFQFNEKENESVYAELESASEIKSSPRIEHEKFGVVSVEVDNDDERATISSEEVKSGGDIPEPILHNDTSYERKNNNSDAAVTEQEQEEEDEAWDPWAIVGFVSSLTAVVLIVLLFFLGWNVFIVFISLIAALSILGLLASKMALSNFDHGSMLKGKTIAIIGFILSSIIVLAVCVWLVLEWLLSGW